MPYSKPSDVPDAVPDGKKAQFMEVWNSAYKKAKDDGKSDDEAEKSAFAQAWAVINKKSQIPRGTIEIRSFPITDLYARADGKTLTGHAAVFDQWTQIGEPEWGFQECVRPGCFQADMESAADIRCLLNHDTNCLLGRTASKTLRCNEDAGGLRFEVDLPDTQLGHDVKILVTRGDLSGCSFSFEVVRDRWTEETTTGGKVALKRELLAVKLYDLGPVTFPAYEQTDVAVRALVTAHAPKHEAEEGLKDIERQLEAMRLAAEIEFSKSR